MNRNAAAWFSDHRSEIEKPGLNPFAQAASLKILAEYERDPASIEALGARNRWPGRTGVPIEEYFGQWEASCPELEASPLLPNRLRQMFDVSYAGYPSAAGPSHERLGLNVGSWR